MAIDTVTKGFVELERELASLPSRAAERLQKVEFANMRDHKRDVAKMSKGSSHFKRAIAQGKGVVRIEPENRNYTPRRLEDVKVESVSYWMGHGETAAQGVAARVETTIGGGINVPKKGRFMFLPAGDFVTSTGRPRRQGKERIDLSKIPDTFIVRRKSGSLAVVQRLGGQTTGQFERQGGGIKGIKTKALGERTRIIGYLVRSATQFAGLAFFRAWQAGERKRLDRYDRLLDDLVAGRGLKFAPLTRA